MEFLQNLPLSTLSLVLISSSLILTVLIGGMVFLRRGRKSGLALVPQDEAPHHIEIEKLGATAPEEEILSWEAELAAKI